MPQVVIANRLKDGIVVFLGTDGAWLERVADSTPSTTPEEGEKLQEAGLRAEREQLVVGPTLIDVEQRDGAWVPIKRLWQAWFTASVCFPSSNMRKKSAAPKWPCWIWSSAS